MPDDDEFCAAVRTAVRRYDQLCVAPSADAAPACTAWKASVTAMRRLPCECAHPPPPVSNIRRGTLDTLIALQSGRPLGEGRARACAPLGIAPQLD